MRYTCCRGYNKQPQNKKKGGVIKMKFGVFIKKKRLERKMGLRVFAGKIKEDPGNWCRVEKGIFSPPSDIKILNKVCEVLNVSGNEKDKMFDLAAKGSKEKIPADIRQQFKVNDIVPVLFRTIEKKKLSKEKLAKLVKRIQNEY